MYVCVTPSWQRDFWAKGQYTRGMWEVCQRLGFFTENGSNGFSGMHGDKVTCTKAPTSYKWSATTSTMVIYQGCQKEPAACWK